MRIEDAIKHLADLADGWECGAKMENAIVAAYQPELDAFTSRDQDVQQHDVRLLRAVIDARRNRDSFTKDAEALRTALSVLTASATPTPSNGDGDHG